ncbi:MAG: hypothetical protein LBS11_08285 [Oscillospiraceae bacterium]|jgi:hypothetical protein|nr:hypothetical protein [Oscillospiraceae bacterium]
MTPINQNPGASQQPNNGPYIDWQALHEARTGERLSAGQYETASPDTDAVPTAYPADYPDDYDAIEDVEPFAGTDCPDAYKDMGYVTADGGGCIYTATLSQEVHSSLTRIVESIAKGEVAGSEMLKASSSVLECLADTNGCELTNLPEAMDATLQLAQKVASLECVLTKKLCCTLTSLCDCGQSPTGPGCCLISEDMEGALSSIVASIADQETAASDLVKSGSKALECAIDSDNPTLTQTMLDTLGEIASASADVEAALSSKLCMSLGAITSCSPDMPSSLIDPLEQLIASIVDTEEGATALVTTGAAALGASTTSPTYCDYDEIKDIMGSVDKLTASALKIEEVTMHKLCLALNALCGDDISGQLQCELGDCQGICNKTAPI